MRREVRKTGGCISRGFGKRKGRGGKRGVKCVNS